MAVSKAVIIHIIGRFNNRLDLLNTYLMEMPVPYSVYPHISEECPIWVGEIRYMGNNSNSVQIQEGLYLLQRQYAKILYTRA